jgi:hypothetical protein
MTKSRRRRWTELVVHMGHTKNSCRIFIGKLERKRLLGRPRREGRIIFKYISEK